MLAKPEEEFHLLDLMTVDFSLSQIQSPERSLSCHDSKSPPSSPYFLRPPPDPLRVDADHVSLGGQR